jgi:hypothetical protein
MNAWISFNCFSSVEALQGVNTEHKECIDRICFSSKAQKR